MREIRCKGRVSCLPAVWHRAVVEVCMTQPRYIPKHSPPKRQIHAGKQGLLPLHSRPIPQTTKSRRGATTQMPKMGVFENCRGVDCLVNLHRRDAVSTLAELTRLVSRLAGLSQENRSANSQETRRPPRRESAAPTAPNSEPSALIELWRADC